MSAAQPGTREIATLGGGCFWCLEAVYDELEGVEDIVSGYASGAVADPSYAQVGSGRTGHAEVVQVTFDPQVIAYQELLEVFFTIHDPTTPDGRATTSARSTARSSSTTARSSTPWPGRRSRGWGRRGSGARRS